MGISTEAVQTCVQGVIVWKTRGSLAEYRSSEVPLPSVLHPAGPSHTLLHQAKLLPTREPWNPLSSSRMTLLASGPTHHRL